MTDADQRARPADSGLTSRTASGLRWTYMAALGSGVMQLVYTSSTSRLLDQDDFGLMAIANLVVNFSVYFAQMGVVQALIQKPELSRDDMRAGFTTAVVFGGVVTATLWLLAPWVAGLFGKPAVAPVLQVLGLTFVLTALNNTSESLLRRELRFRELAVTQVQAFFLGYLVIGLGMALSGFGVWSLVGATLGANVAGSTLRYRLVRHPLAPMLRWAPYRRLLSFGSRVSLINFGEFWAVNLDTFTVGRYAATALVGVYNRAFYLVNLPLTYITQSMSNVLLPGFSKLQHERERVARVYLEVIALVAALMLPLVAGMAVAHRELVGVVLGAKWDAAAVLVPILAFAAAWNILTRFSGIICEAVAELNRKLALQATYLALLVVAMMMAAGGPLWAYATALAVGELVRHAMYLVVLRRVLDLPVTAQLRAYAPAVLLAAVVAGAAWPVRMVLELAGLPVFARLVVLMAVSAVALAAGVRLPALAGVRTVLVRRILGSVPRITRHRLARMLLPELATVEDRTAAVGGDGGGPA